MENPPSSKYRTSESERLQIIKLKSEGVSVDNISLRFNRDEQTIRNILKRFDQENRVSDLKHPGPKRNSEHDERIRSLLIAKPFTRDADAIRELDLPFSRWTYSRICDSLGLSSYISASNFSMTDKHREARLLWCYGRERSGTIETGDKSCFLMSSPWTTRPKLSFEFEGHLGRVIRTRTSSLIILRLSLYLSMVLSPPKGLAY